MSIQRLYHFRFQGIAEKITVQAGESLRARQILNEQIENMPDYKDKLVIDETTESLVTGITTRMLHGKKHTWNGTSWKPGP